MGSQLAGRLLSIVTAAAGLCGPEACSCQAHPLPTCIAAVYWAPQVGPHTICVPLTSWYHCSFDKHDPQPGRYRCVCVLCARACVSACLPRTTRARRRALQRPRFVHTRHAQVRQVRALARGRAARPVAGPDGVQPPRNRLGRVHAHHHQHQCQHQCQHRPGPAAGSASSSASGKPRGHRCSGPARLERGRGGQHCRWQRANRGAHVLPLPAAPGAAILAARVSAARQCATQLCLRPTPSTVLAPHTAAPLSIVCLSTLRAHGLRPELGKAMGCLQLEHVLDAVQATVHVYGHR